MNNPDNLMIVVLFSFVIFAIIAFTIILIFLDRKPKPNELGRSSEKERSMNSKESVSIEKQLQATELALSAMKASNELLAEGKVAEASTVMTHFVTHEAFTHLPLAHRDVVMNTTNTIRGKHVEVCGRTESAWRDETAGVQDESEGLVPGLTAPAVTGGTPVAAYVCGSYRAVVSTNIHSIGPIQYRYIMNIGRAESSSPIMFITAESNDMLPEMVATLDKGQRELIGNSMTTELVLGVFDSSGHINLGPKDSISDLEGFTRVALQIMKDRLNLPEEVREGFASVLNETQNAIFNLYGVTQPNDAQKLKASFYLCVSGIAILNDAGGGAAPHVVDRLVEDTRELIKPLFVRAEELSNSPGQLNGILSQLPSGAIGSTKLNGLAAFEAMYFSLGQDLMNDILSHNQGPTGTPGYAGIVVVDGVLGEGKSKENFMELTMQMLQFTQGLVKSI